MSIIIDAHSHYMPLQVAQKTMFFKVGWSDVDRQLAVMDEYGINKALLLYPTTDAHLQMGGWQNVCNIYNEEIAEVVSSHPDRFIGAGILPIDEPQNFPRELHRIKSLGLKVISLGSSYEGVYLDDPIFFSVYEFATQNALPIHVHPQIIHPIGEDRVSDPLLTPVLEYVFDVSVCIGKMMMSGTLQKFPDVKFIFAHYGGVLPLVKERFDSTYQMLRKRNFVKDLGKLPSAYFSNIYVDTSGSRSLNSLLCALELVDFNHVLFGSDFPANQTVRESMEAVRQQKSLSVDEKKFILGNNMLNLLSL